jgi:hypothetical protein
MHIGADMLIGQVQIFFPVSKMTASLYIGMSSYLDAILETLFLVIILILMNRNNDLLNFLERNKENLGIILPLLTISASTLLVVSRIGVWRDFRILVFDQSVIALSFLAISHVILVVLFSISVACIMGEYYNGYRHNREFN